MITEKEKALKLAEISKKIYDKEIQISEMKEELKELLDDYGYVLDTETIDGGEDE